MNPEHLLFGLRHIYTQRQRDQSLTLRLGSVNHVHLHAISSDARPGGVGEVSDGRPALTASPELQGLVVVLREDGPPAAA